MARRGRTSYVMGPEHRDKIKNSNILRNLIEHAEGAREMSATQVSVGLGLLKKVMPDLQNVQLEGNPDQPVLQKLTVEIVKPSDSGSS